MLHTLSSFAGVSVPFQVWAVPYVRVSDIFFQFMASFLILFIFSFTEQKFLISNKSRLLVIYFMDPVFGVIFKKASPYPRTSRFFPLLSFRSFIVLHCILRSMIHFELILEKEVRSGSRFTFLYVNVQLLQHYLLKRHYFVLSVFSHIYPH